MNANFKKIRCPHCRKKILATLGTANFCPNCHKPVTIELGLQYICKACKHHFRSPKTDLLRCPKCGSTRIKKGNRWYDWVPLL